MATQAEIDEENRLNALNQGTSWQPVGYQPVSTWPAPAGTPAPEGSPGWTPPPAPVVAPPPITTPNPNLTPEQQSAHALITGQLQSYGLTDLGEWMWQQYLNGEPLDAIWLEMQDRPEYQSRFPGMAQLRANGRAITEGQYIDYERSAIQIMRAAGIPPGVMDSREALGQMIGGEVSLQEFQSRLNDYQTAVFQTPQEVRDELKAFYGVNEGDLLGFFLDPNQTLPLLEQRFRAAQAGGTAIRTGYGDINQQAAERLAELGLTQEQLTQGFGNLYQGRELFQGLPGTQEGAISQDTQWGATFEGRAADQETIRRRAEGRVAAFAGGGGFASGQRGLSGIGSAST
jgi:hypothetical protein